MLVATEESHTRQVLAHAHAGEGGPFWVLLEVRGSAPHNGSCKGGVEYSGRRTLALTCGGRGDVIQAATKAGWDWCDVVNELQRDGRGADQPPTRHEPHRISVVRVRARFCWTSSVADAVSLIRTSWTSSSADK